MITQPTLWDGPIEPNVSPIADDGDRHLGSLADRFADFDARNPQVYRLLEEIAVDLARKGFKRIGIALIYERVRWLYAVQTSGDNYKLNNSYRAFYARKLMDRVPALAGRFEIRDSPHNGT